MAMSDPLDSVVFITLPENFTPPSHAFRIDPAVPLPVQRTARTDGGENAVFDISQLSWEMILAGILTVLAYDPKNPHIDYYRSLILTLRPDLKQELTEAAILKIKNEDFDIAEEIFAALRGLAPDDTAVTLNSALFFDQRADEFRRSGLSEEADACDDSADKYYRKAMDAEPPAPDAFFNAGFFYLKQKNFSRGRSCFESFLSLAGTKPEAERSENETYKIQRAEEIVRDISNRNLDDELFKAAYDFISMGEEEKGLEKIREFITKNPCVWNAWFLLGWALRRLGRWKDGKAAFEQSIACGEENADTCNELAICCLELGQFDESRKYLFRALELEPENTKVMSNLGFLALRSGKPDEARSYFLSVLEFDPDDKIAQRALDDMEKGC